jgi:hypothetical protein
MIVRHLNGTNGTFFYCLETPHDETCGDGCFPGVPLKGGEWDSPIAKDGLDGFLVNIINLFFCIFVPGVLPGDLVTYGYTWVHANHPRQSSEVSCLPILEPGCVLTGIAGASPRARAAASFRAWSHLVRLDEHGAYKLK